jgi:dienelactone hydrolase
VPRRRESGLVPRCLLAVAVYCPAILTLPSASAAALDLPFTISKPAGDGPFPAVVLLHDCSGLGFRSSGATSRWSSVLTAKGYVTIWPDSFSTRGHPRGVCVDASPPRIFPRQRAADAYAALEHLRSLPYVDSKRVAVMGGSNGGSSTLAGIIDAADNKRPDGAQFAAAIALYPACGRNYGGWSVARANGGHDITGYSGVFKPLSPLLILIGDRDDWTPAEPCRQLTTAAQGAGYPVEIVVYPGVHHSFDSPFRLRFLAERRNVNSPTGRGATTAGNEEAWTDAVQRVERFLALHLGVPQKK